MNTSRPQPSHDEIARLERLEREKWTDFHFLRQSPREHQHLPFERRVAVNPAAAVACCAAIVILLAIAPKAVL